HSLHAFLEVVRIHTPSAHHEAVLRNLAQIVVVQRSHRVGSGAQLLGTRGGKREQVVHADSTMPPHLSVALTAPDRGIVLSPVRSGWMEHDPYQPVLLLIPAPPKYVKVGATIAQHRPSIALLIYGADSHLFSHQRQPQHLRRGRQKSLGGVLVRK